MIIGSEGYIGKQFCRAFPEALAINRQQLNLNNPTINFDTTDRSCALIAAGIGNPVICERDPLGTFACNVEGTLKLGDMLIKKGLRPIYFSTDYVFNDCLSIAPLNAYGRQKAELEERGASMGGLVIRLSKVYGTEKGDKTLFDEMASKLIQGVSILAAYDQIFSPVFIGDVISRVTSLMCENSHGIVNVVGPSFATRLDMARYLAAKLKVDPALIKEISLTMLKDGVQRPKFLKLTSSFSAMDWKEGITAVVKNYAQ